MRHLRSTAAFGAIVAAAALFAGGAVKAQLTPTFDVVTPNGGNFTWSYDLDVAGAARLRPGGGTFFTLYDIAGYVAGSAFAPAADWSISEQATGMTPTGVSVPDGGATNVTFTYIGAATTGPSSMFDGPDAFGFDSTSGASKPGGVFSYQNPKNNPSHPDDGLRQFGAGGVVLPSAVPETSSLMLLVPGLVPFGIMLRRRVRK